MPQHGGSNKKKGRRNTQGLKDARRGSKSQPSPATDSLHGSTRQPPTFDAPSGFDTAFQQKGKTHTDTYRTQYSRYKAATKRVCEYLEANARNKNNLGPDEPLDMNVSSLAATADWMAEAGMPVDPDILKDLKFSIRVRSKVARSVFGGGDVGHQYLLDALLYCWKDLDSLPREATEKNVADENEGDHSNNRFEALQESGERNEDDLAEDIFSSQEISRPPLGDNQIALDYILDSEDRMDAIMFLDALDELMQAVANQFASVELQNPHITTVYRLLAIVFFPEQAKEVIQITREHGRKVCLIKDASLFVGDCLECCFRDPNPPDGHSKIRSAFFRRFKLNSKGAKAIHEIHHMVRCHMIIEGPLQYELEVTAKSGHASHNWFRFQHIGGDQAILHTMRLLQLFGWITPDPPKDRVMVLHKGYFGSSPWQPGTSSKIHNEMDELRYQCKMNLLRSSPASKPSLTHGNIG